jgi:short-subunit dehydrogenase
MISFSESLRHELRDTRIHVNVLCIGGVISNPEKAKRFRHPGWFAPASALTCEQVAEEAIIKLLQKKSVVIPGRWNRFLIMIDKVVPAFITNKIIQ